MAGHGATVAAAPPKGVASVGAALSPRTGHPLAEHDGELITESQGAVWQVTTPPGQVASADRRLASASLPLVPAEGVVAPSACATVGEATAHLNEPRQPFGAVPRRPTIAHAPVADGAVLHPARRGASVAQRGPARWLFPLTALRGAEVRPLQWVDLRRTHDLQTPKTPVLFAPV